MKTIGVIGAMPSELRYMFQHYQVAEHSERQGFDVRSVVLGDKKIVFACSGIGRANAAMCTQMLISEYHCDCILNSGIAGGMDRRVQVTDIVLGKEMCYHDFDPHFLKDYPPYQDSFTGDAALLDLAKKTCEKEGIPCFEGRIVSGDVFVTDSAVKKQIEDAFHPQAVDMETAAIAHTAYRSNIPFLSIRCISDNADDEAAMSFDQLEEIAANRVAKIVIDLIQEIA